MGLNVCFVGPDQELPLPGSLVMRVNTGELNDPTLEKAGMEKQ